MKKRNLLILLALFAMTISPALCLADGEAATDKAPTGEIKPAPSAEEGPAADGPAKEGEDTTDGKDGDEVPQKKRGFGDMGLMIGMMGLLMLMFIFMGRGQRKKQAQRREMLNSLKKGDKVTTMGGIVGTVMEVRDKEIVVKVNESNDMKMRFARWAVYGVGDSSKSEDPQQEGR